MLTQATLLEAVYEASPSRLCASNAAASSMTCETKLCGFLIIKVFFSRSFVYDFASFSLPSDFSQQEAEGKRAGL